MTPEFLKWWMQTYRILNTARDKCEAAWLEATRQAYIDAARICEQTRTSPSRLIGATWQEPLFKDGAACANAIRAKLKKSSNEET